MPGMPGMAGMAGMPRMAGMPEISTKRLKYRIIPLVPLERTVPQALERLIPKFSRLFFDKKNHDFDNNQKYPLQYIQGMPASYKILNLIIKENLTLFVRLLNGIRFNVPNNSNDIIKNRIEFEHQQPHQLPEKYMVNIGDLYAYLTPSLIDFVMSLYSPVINRGPNNKCSIRWFNLSPKLLILDTDPRLAFLDVIPSGNYVENAYRLLDGYLRRVRYTRFINTLGEYDSENFSTKPGWHDRRRDIRRDLLYDFFNLCPQDIARLNKDTMLFRGRDSTWGGKQPMSQFLLDITPIELNNKPLRDMFRADGYKLVIDQFQDVLIAAKNIWDGRNPQQNTKIIEDIFKFYETYTPQLGGARRRKTMKLRT
jgi:hypothetical protein